MVYVHGVGGESEVVLCQPLSLFLFLHILIIYITIIIEGCKFKIIDKTDKMYYTFYEPWSYYDIVDNKQLHFISIVL